jgi:hypothetical protein
MIWLWSGCEMVVNVEDEERHAALIKSRGPHQMGKHTFTSNIYIYIYIIKHIICDKLAVLYIYGFRMFPGYSPLPKDQPLHRTAPAAFGWDPWSPTGRCSGRRATDRSCWETPTVDAEGGRFFQKKLVPLGKKLRKSWKNMVEALFSSQYPTKMSSIN